MISLSSLSMFLVNDLIRYISLTTKGTRRETNEHIGFNIISKH